MHLQISETTQHETKYQGFTSDFRDAWTSSSIFPRDWGGGGYTSFSFSDDHFSIMPVHVPAPKLIDIELYRIPILAPPGSASYHKSHVSVDRALHGTTHTWETDSVGMCGQRYLTG